MARSFNGSSQQLYASSAVATVPPIAMSCWFWADPAIAQGGVLLSLTRSDPGLDRFELRAEDSPAVVEALTRDSGGFGTASSATVYSTGAWHHAFGVWYTSSDRQVWLDGGGHGTNSTSRVPASIAETCLGASRISSPYSHFQGYLAEAAIWAGSEVESMGASEASVLAQGFSPRCLGRWHGRLVLYQDLIRPTNRPGTGPAMTEASSPGVVAHPRILHTTPARLGQYPPNLYLGPYRAGAGAVDSSRAMRGFAATTGAELGTTFPVGEVSS